MKNKILALLFVLSASAIFGCNKPAAPVVNLSPHPVQPEQPVPAKSIVVYDFGANWCAPCRRFAPTFEAWSKKYTKPGVSFVKVDVDKNRELSKKYNISSVPTVIVEVNGEVVEKFEGAPTEDQVAKHLK